MIALIALLLAADAVPTSRAGKDAPNAVPVQGVSNGKPITVTCPDGTCSGGGGAGTTVNIADPTTPTQKAKVDANGAISVTCPDGTCSGGGGGSSSYSDGSAGVQARTFDADTGAGTQNVAGMLLRKPASGGSVAFGTSTDPIGVQLFDGGGSALDARARIWTLSSGTDSVNVGNFPSTYDVSDRAARLLGVVYGSQGQQLKQTATNFNLQTELATGGTLYDARQIRALTLSDVVTVNNAFALDATLTGGSQKAIVRGGAKGATAAADVTSTANGVDHQGLDVAVQGTVTVSGAVAATESGTWTVQQGTTAGTNAGAWWTQIGDTTNGPAAVKAASTAAVAADKALVVAVSPNNTIAATQSGTWTVQPGNTANTTAWKVDGSAVTQPVSIAAGVTQGAGNTANPWAVQGTVADGVNIAGNPVPVGYKSVAVASAPATVTAGQETYGIGSIERIPYVRPWHPNLISCNVAVSTATTLTAFGGSCAAPGANLSIYITDITFSASAASGTAADSMPTIKSGTGGTCGTGTAVVFEQFNPANGGFHAPFHTPIRVAANSEICWIDSTAGSKAVHVNGFIAP